jgi:hypothetical protein
LNNMAQTLNQQTNNVNILHQMQMQAN